MRKKIFILGILLVFVICNIQGMVYAIDEEKFISANKTEVEKGEIAEITIDFTKIDYDEFKIVISSDYTNSNIEEAYTEEEITSEIENDELIIFSNKEGNTGSIVLYYTIPEEACIGDIIVINAVVYNTNNEEEKLEEEISFLIVETEIIEEEEVKVEATELEMNLEEDISKDIENSYIKVNENTQSFSSNNITANNQNYAGSSQITDMQEDVEEATYNGSSNNYLESLSIEGYEFTTDFSKENLTYFITLEEAVDSLEITAEAEDDDAKICVYGNNDLSEGTNKILISVTAENGNVRYYRIFVNI